jgi:hypothetical protein
MSLTCPEGNLLAASGSDKPLIDVRDRDDGFAAENAVVIRELWRNNPRQAIPTPVDLQHCQAAANPNPARGRPTVLAAHRQGAQAGH